MTDTATKPAKATTAAAKPADSEPTLPTMPADAPATSSEPAAGNPTRTKAAWSGVVKNDVEPTRSITRTASGTKDTITFSVYVPQYDRLITVEMSADDAGKHVDNLSAVLDD